MSTQVDLADYVKQKLKENVKRKSKAFVRDSILTNPVVWYIVGALLIVLILFYLVATFVSTTSAAVSQNVISEKIMPPQIYASDLEDLITSDFGLRTHPVTGEAESFHSGIDIGVPEGTPVQSSFDGTVETVSFPAANDPESTKNAGIYVVIKASDPDVALSSRYLHLSQAFVSPGQTVKKGDIIGLSGNTGRSTGAHLHFEMFPDGQTDAVDPKPYVMVMSKLIDVATEEAFKAFKKISWFNSAIGLNGGQPSYYSKKMIYLSDLYFAAPVSTFNSAGVGYYKNLSTGEMMGSFSSNGDSTTVDAPPDDEDVVSIPVNTGSLTDPFFIQYASAAQAEEQRSGVPASITLAQAALESSRGASAICNNMFGIKANSSYRGDFCYANTHEEVNGVRVPTKSKFRAYSSVLGSFADHSDFLLRNSRYRIALSKENPYEFANELQRAGYATDSQYANKLKSIIRSQNLASLDMNGGIDPLTGQPFYDVSYTGGGPSESGEDGYITLTFGISQYYGNKAATAIDKYDSNGHYIETEYSVITDPMTGKEIINMENYNHVVGSVGVPPRLMVKDIPQAIQVTLHAPNSTEFYVSKVDYIKGMY